MIAVVLHLEKRIHISGLRHEPHLMMEWIITCDTIARCNWGDSAFHALSWTCSDGVPVAVPLPRSRPIQDATHTATCSIKTCVNPGITDDYIITPPRGGGWNARRSLSGSGAVPVVFRWVYRSRRRCEIQGESWNAHGTFAGTPLAFPSVHRWSGASWVRVRRRSPQQAGRGSGDDRVTG